MGGPMGGPMGPPMGGGYQGWGGPANQGGYGYGPQGGYQGWGPQGQWGGYGGGPGASYGYGNALPSVHPLQMYLSVRNRMS